MLDKLKVIKPLIIGLGIAGKRHLDAQLKLGFETGVFSLSIAKTDPLRTQKNVVVFDDLMAGLDWANLVHVCTPDDLHTEFVAEALKKGKSVLCEKSFTTSLKDALFLQKLAHENNCLLLIGQNYRLTPAFAEIRKRVLAGDLGTLKFIKTTYLHDINEYQKRAPLRKNQDFLYIGGSHAVDLACWVTNEQIADVESVSSKPEGKKAYSYPPSYEIKIKFASGLSGQIELDASSPRSISGTDLIVEGEKGKLVSHIKSDKILFYKDENKNPQSIQLPIDPIFTTALEVKIIDEFLLGKRNSYHPLPDVDENINTIRILDTISKSTTSGRNELV